MKNRKNKTDTPINYEITTRSSGKGKVYISGQISGRKNYKTDFEKAERLLRKQGYDVYNPARQTKGATLRAIMLLDILNLTQCDYIYFLPTADSSEGSKIERTFAQYVGIKELIP
ncbi:MAG: DUF4406 domain-containing protein [Endomicrobium sp.]|jgi:hypothetical protein|nr:DUF4406 domain-containing protein [Endomicrobium sp.]